MHKPFIALILSVPMMSFSAHAETINMRAGLWEVRTTSNLLKLVSLIPADQLKKLEILAKEYDLEMPQVDNGAAISKTCITQTMAAQKTLPSFYQEELGCTSNKAIRDGNHYKINFTCNSAELKGKGTAQGLITGAKSFSGKTQFVGLAQGVSVNEKATMTGKWVRESCGNNKPL